MPHQVVLTPWALKDLRENYAWAIRHAPNTAADWLGRLQTVIGTLANHPARCPLAREDRKVSVELRQLNFGRRNGAFRVVFAIHDSEVRVLRILRAQRRPLTRREIEQADDRDSPQ